MIERSAVCLLFLLIVGCVSPEQKDYERALKRDSIGGWERFIKKHGDGDHADSARGRLAELQRLRKQKEEAQDNAAWEAASGDGSLHAYFKYLHHRPDGRFAAQAQRTVREGIEQRIEAATGGNRDLIRPGSKMSMDGLEVEELIEAMGATHVRYVVRSTGGVRTYRLHYPMKAAMGVSRSQRIMILREPSGTFGLTLSGIERTARSVYDENSVGFSKISRSKFHRTDADDKRFSGSALVVDTRDGIDVVYEFSQ